jgi:hypothetical protein
MIKESRGLLTSAAAETLALEAFSWLAGEPEALGRFLALAGIGPGNLRTAAAAPGFLGGVLDFLVGDEALLVSYAREAGIRPEQIAAARRALGGDE